MIGQILLRECYRTAQVAFSWPKVKSQIEAKYQLGRTAWNDLALTLTSRTNIFHRFLVHFFITFLDSF